MNYKIDIEFINHRLSLTGDERLLENLLKFIRKKKIDTFHCGKDFFHINFEHVLYIKFTIDTGS